MSNTPAPISLYSEATPNPASMKFVANRYLLEGHSVEYKKLEETEDAPLAKALFSFDWVQSVFISENYITLLRNNDQDWSELIPDVKEYLKNYMEAGKVVVHKLPEQVVSSDNAVEQRIHDVLRDYVRPAVQQDGGAIVFKSFDEASGELTLTLQGACSGCPSSMVTLKSGIENMMSKMVPSVKSVVAEEA